MKLKTKAFQRYKEFIRTPVLEHKRGTYNHTYRLHPDERSPNMTPVVDQSQEDKYLIEVERKEIIPDSNA
jgi:hypothetical protein